MSARVVRYLLERLTALDLNLAFRFGRRELNRVIAHLHANRHIGGPAYSSVGSNREALQSFVCLGGLEVEYSSGSTLTVKAGAMAMTNGSPGTETRPGTWSGRVETDDHSRPICVLPADANVAPSVAIPGALSDYEWWTVTAADSEDVTVETDSARKVYNEGTGTFDSASAAKVKQDQLVLTVTRGTAGGAIPTVAAGSALLALVLVPSGATDLSAAVIFDCRRLPFEDPGPNMVGGNWECPLDGLSGSPSTDIIWRGEAWARIRGERLRVVNIYGFRRDDLIEPGADWGPGGTPTIAWVYLTKVKNTVPRPLRKGASPAGYTNFEDTDGYMSHGALVVSPTLPKCGIFDVTPGVFVGSTTGYKWDLRPSASLTLPNSVSVGGGVKYPWGGQVVAADDALCVGFLVYLDVVSALPVFGGDLHMSQEGWVSGDVLTQVDDQIVTLSTAESGGIVTTTGTAKYISALLEATNPKFPNVGVRMSLFGSCTDDDQRIDWTRHDAGKASFAHPHNSAFLFYHVSEREIEPGTSAFIAARGTNNGLGTLSTFVDEVVAVRFPYGEALAT